MASVVGLCLRSTLNPSKICDSFKKMRTSYVNYCIVKRSSLCRLYSKEASDPKTFEFADEQEVEEDHRDREIEQKRNKSRLSSKHFNILHGRPPYDEPQVWFHHTVKYKRRMFARYGLYVVDAPLGIMWPTKEELEERKEYEKYLRPDSFQTMVQKFNEEEAAEELSIQTRQQDIAAKYAKLEQWKRELGDRVQKKLREAEEVRLKKERLVEEVRRHFGFKVDPKDERFKEMLEQKERQEKKREKEARKKIKQEKMLQHLLNKEAAAAKEAAEKAKAETEPSAS